ncbi:MAG: cysteine synthase family protein [Bacteroidia bacterium]|nr:cysteine synthase family protein [Bacteroidia bacterium]
MCNERIRGLESMIGNTPMLEIKLKYKGEVRVIYAKAENLNMTGSIKDRMALHILRCAYERGEIRTGDPIFEATSGNTGISVSAIGCALGHPVTIYMPDWMSEERKNLIKSMGAKVRLVSKEEGGFLGSISMANEAASRVNGFLPSQFSNEHNAEAHYLTTAQEIWWQLRYRYKKPDAFIAGVGTGGTIMGVGKFLKEKEPSILVHPLEPLSSPTLSTGYKIGKHRIQGISDEFIPSILKLDKVDNVVAVDDGDAIIMAQMLARNLGIGVGISSGANFIGALMVQNKIGKDKVVVTIFSDDNKKYLSTDLLREEPVKDHFLSTDIELLSFSSFKRVCTTCCKIEDCVIAAYEGKDTFKPQCLRCN